jgi:hypothetical protein
MTTPSSVTSTLSHSNVDDNTQAGDYTDNQDDEKFYSLPSCSDNMVGTQDNRYSSRQDEQSTESPSSVYQPILSPETGSNISIPYGVD